MWEEGVDFLVHLLCLFQALCMEGTEIPSSNYHLTITIHGFLKTYLDSSGNESSSEF